jgi:hypothetical protein
MATVLTVARTLWDEVIETGTDVSRAHRSGDLAIVALPVARIPAPEL